MTGKAKADPRVDKRRVTMISIVATGVGDDGEPVLQRHEAIDYVRPDFLDAYVADAKSNWQIVTVSDEPDVGPGGYHGPTVIPDHLDHPDAGAVFPETPEDQR